MEWFFKQPEHAEFKKQFIKNQLGYAQKMAGFAICYYFFFSFLDFYLTNETTWQLFKVRVTFTLLLIVLFLLSFHQRLKKYWQVLIGLLVFSAGVGVNVMSAYVPDNFKPIYAQGLLLVIFYGYTMNKLLLMPAIISGFSITLAYFIYAVYFSTIPSEFIITSLFFQTSTNVFGVSSVYFMQKTAFKAYRKNEKLKNHNASLLKQSETDGLTGIGNRRFFNNRFERLFKQRICGLDYVSLLLCDIDLFKNYNDTYGHLKGDDTLIKVAELLALEIPENEGFVARFGGEEFIMVLFNYDFDKTQHFITGIQQKLEQENIRHTESTVADILTLSFGYVTFDVNNTSPSQAYKQLTKLADRCLYKAKKQGRNQFIGTTFN